MEPMKIYKSNNSLQTKTISVTSGKGGVGKTTFVVQLAITLSDMGKKILILDGDIGLANVDIFLGLHPYKTLQNFFENSASLDEILLKADKNIHVIPSASGLTELKNVDVYQRKKLMDEVSFLENRYDYFLVDTASGVDENVQYLNSTVQDVVVVINPDPASLTDSYALMKLLKKNHKISRFSIMINKVVDEREAKKVYAHIHKVVSQFLQIHLTYRGYIPLDQRIKQAIRQKSVQKMRPSTASSMALKKVAYSFENSSEIPEMAGNLQFFWNQLLNPL